jgi:hypothetical protein
VAIAGCSEPKELPPPPIGPVSTSGLTLPIGSDTDDASSSSTSFGSSGSSSSSDEGPAPESTAGTTMAIEDSLCVEWAELYVMCSGSGTVIELAAGCEFFLSEWEMTSLMCRTLVEELMMCNMQLSCADFLGWENDHMISPECAPALDELEQMCPVDGTSTG